ncbi:glycosyltransferase [Motilimonas sp. KMU-193]|uniref:glycosyltransferase n=1 Tax=Motilimonas sp. KMU-193 TaxID=3388668 RepID=UPI00396B367E
MINKSVVVVLGMHRSGTSAVAELLSSFGVDFGQNLIPAAQDNKRGFWEDRDFVEINERLLAELGTKWSGLATLSNPVSEELTTRACAFFKTKKSDSKYIGLKDPRHCRLVHFWHDIFVSENADVKYIYAIRHPNAVVSSLVKRNGYSETQAYLLWMSYVLDSYRNIEEYDYYVLNYEELLKDTKKIENQVKHYLGIESVTDSDVIDSSLSNYSGDESNNAIGMASLAEKIFQLVLSDDRESKLWDEVCSEYDRLYEQFSWHDATINKLALELEESISFSSRINNDVLELVNKNSELCSEIEQHKLFSEHLSSDLNSLKDELGAEIDKHKIFNEHLVNDIDVLNEQNLALANEVKSHKEFREKLSIDIKNLNEVISGLESDIEVKNDEIEWLTVDREQRISIMDGMTASKSWRYTAPFRNARRYVTSFSITLKGKLINSGLIKYLRRFKLIKQKLSLYISQLPDSRQNLLYSSGVTKNRHDLLFSDEHRAIANKSSSSEKLPEISISVVTYNNGRWFGKFLSSLLAQQYPINLIHLHFVDNGSTDDTVCKLNEAKSADHGFASFNVYERENLGFGAGHDYAFSQTNTELVLISNIDLEFEYDSLVEVVSFATSDAEDVACWELRQAPYEHPKFYDPLTFETAWCSHACILVRRSAYFNVGGYEEKIFMYGEDVELSYRFRSLGYRIKFIPSALVHHYTYEEAGEVKPLQFSGSTLANSYLRLRYGNFYDKLAIIPLQLALYLRGNSVPNCRDLVKRNIGLIFKNAPHFLKTIALKHTYFPFRGFDYEMIREGAFYELKTEVRKTESLPLVTIITRTYRGREFLLKECIASVINQTYPNIQHIIVEDGGDTMASLVGRVKEAYPSINIEFYGFEKKGRSYTGNQGLAKSKGKYCLFLDDDDLLFPDHVETLAYELLSNSKIGAAYSLAWAVSTDVNKEDSTYTEYNHFTLPLFYQEFSREVLLKHNYIPIQAILFKRSLFEEVGGFEEDMDYLEDWNLWTKYGLISEFKFVPKTTSMYRIPNSQQQSEERSALLDSAYETAISKQKEMKVVA